MSFEIVYNKDEILSCKSILIDRFYEKNSFRYILGINEWTDKLLIYCGKNNLTINGIIDDYTNQKMYSNLPIIKMKDIKEKDALIISCVIYGRLISAINNLKANNLNNVLSYLDLCLVDEKLSYVSYCTGSKEDISENQAKYYWLYDNLTDVDSKETLRNIIDFRYNFNIEAMKSFKYNLEEQYFDNFINFDDEEVFVDCGGFDGKTTQKFIDLCPNYKAVYYFEPVKQYLEKSQEILKQNKNIYYFNKGTYKNNAILSFCEKGSESNISESGDKKIEVVKLDDIIDDKVTYIKMDVEGAEYESLIGCERLIKAYKPKLAICVYHKQEDFWKIPELILGYNKDYKIYLRHYTEGILETVMYFI